MSENLNPAKTKTSLFVFALVAISCTSIFLWQMWDIHALWTPVGLVDTWPLYDRLMKYMTGQLNLEHYLLDPHVHPHSIVYFLFLMDTILGSGRELVPHFATLFSIVGLGATFCFVVWQAFPDRTLSNIRLYAFLFGTIVLVSGVSEASAIPFQCVVIVTRFLYILILAALVYCQFYPNKPLHITAIAAAVVAVSFYASGGVLAGSVVLIHVIFFRRRRWLYASFLPLITYLILIARYTKPGAETEQIKAILGHFQFGHLEQLVMGSISYYATAFREGWPVPLEMGFGPSMLALYALGAVFAGATVVWAAWVLIAQFFKIVRRDYSCAPSDVASCLMALVSLWVFLSSLSAALLWMARARIFGPGMGMPIHFAVLTSGRYAAFSSLAVVVFLYMVLNLKRRGWVVDLSVAALILTVLIGASSLTSEKMAARTDYYRNGLDNAATALLLGMTPTDPEASAVWPGVAADWYWPTELPKVEAYLHSANLSYAHGLPQLGQTLTAQKTAIAGYQTQPVAEKPDVCRLTGSAPPFHKSVFAPQQFFPVLASGGQVVGFALHEGGEVKGHVLCRTSVGRQPLFLSALG
jgi:hypothetical protein